eukprot:jgi/Mesvir1/26949/Mv20669-RA.1
MSAALEAKKRRLAYLEETYGRTPASTSGAAAVSQQHKERDTKGKTGATTGASPAPAVDPLYAALSSEVTQGPLKAVLPVEESLSLAQGAPMAAVEMLIKQLLVSNTKLGNAGAIVQQQSTARKMRELTTKSTLLLDNPTAHFSLHASTAQEAGQSARRSLESSLSRTQRARRGLVLIPEEQRRFSLFLPLHELWKTYLELACTLAEQGMASDRELALVLAAMDLHGCLLSVVSCPVVSLVGVSGIVAVDSSAVLRVISRDDKLHVIPKEGSIFSFDVEAKVGGQQVQRTVTLDGSQLRSYVPGPRQRGGGRKKSSAS